MAGFQLGGDLVFQLFGEGNVHGGSPASIDENLME
jgi:hypothetical protein